MLDLQIPTHAEMECIQDMSDASTELASDLGSTDVEEALPSAHHVLHLVDWDDTILPTTWLSRQGLLNGRAVASEEQQAKLTSLAEAAASTLEAAASIGRVVIVTNAAEGWVQQSCLRFLPTLVPVLQELTIVSARSIFERQGIRCPTERKRGAFDREVEGMADAFLDDLGASLSLVAIGDSSHEHEAVLKAAEKVPGCYTKSLRLAERPTPEQLLEEHLLVAGTLEEVAAHDGDLDIEVATSI